MYLSQIAHREAWLNWNVYLNLASRKKCVKKITEFCGKLNQLKSYELLNWLGCLKSCNRKYFLVTWRLLCSDAHSRSGSHLCGEGAIAIGRLKFGVAAEVLAVDEDVGDGSLASLLLEGGLDVTTVGDVIELDNFVRIPQLAEQLLGLGAERAGRLAVDHDLVGCDLLVNLCNQISCLGHLCCCLSFFFIFD